MRGLRKIGVGLVVAVAASAVVAPRSQANIQPPPELILRLWPLFKSHRPVAQLPADKVRPTSEADERPRPLVAPYVPRKLDINSASFSELQNLPGINSSMAARIFAGRPYRTIQDLESDGIPLNVVRQLAGQVTFGP